MFEGPNLTASSVCANARREQVVGAVMHEDGLL